MKFSYTIAKTGTGCYKCVCTSKCETYLHTSFHMTRQDAQDWAESRKFETLFKEVLESKKEQDRDRILTQLRKAKRKRIQIILQLITLACIITWALTRST